MNEMATIQMVHLVLNNSRMELLESLTVRSAILIEPFQIDPCRPINRSPEVRITMLVARTETAFMVRTASPGQLNNSGVNENERTNTSNIFALG